MKIYIAEKAGFCFGVKRALELINKIHSKGQEIQIYGQLIHNKIVMSSLKKKGIAHINSLDKLDNNKTLIIRTHGIPIGIENKLKKRGIKYIDATCPLVKKTHRIIKKLSRKNTPIIIIGDKNHPEIIAAKSYSTNAYVINSEKEARNIKYKNEINVVAQTTLDSDFFKKIISILTEKVKKVEVYNTICDATKDRQEAVKKMAPKVDFVIVIGGKNSSNTKKLYNISLKNNKHTFCFEKSSDLYESNFLEKVKKCEIAGITAGASTPYDEIENVKKCLESKLLQRR